MTESNESSAKPEARGSAKTALWRPVGLAGLLIVAAALAAWAGGLTRSQTGAVIRWVAMAAGACLIAAAAVLCSGAVRERLLLMRSKVGLILFGSLVGLVLVEACLRVAETVQQATQLSRVDKTYTTDLKTIPDDTLDYRVDPRLPGHDANGFRNTAVPDRADVVTLGDSQTWGYGVPLTKTWPSALGRISDLSVYNMGVGGYGPVQYLVLTEQALRFSPRFLVVAPYMGNDLYDAYRVAYKLDAHAGLRDPSKAAEMAEDNMGRRENKLLVPAEHAQRKPPRPRRGWLVRHLAIARLLEGRGVLTYFRREEAFERARECAQTRPQQVAVCDRGRIRTVFRPSYRMLGVDLDEPRVAEGLRLTKDVLAGISAKTEAHGVQLIVLLIPTKESAYADLMADAHPPESFARILRMEGKARAEIISACASRNIPCVDPLPLMRQALSRNERIYPMGEDGHPRTGGYAVLAAAVHAKIVELSK